MNLSQLEELCSFHPDKRRRVVPKTQETYKLTAKRAIDYFGDIEVSTLSLRMLDDWQEWIESHEEFSIVHQNNYKRRFRTMLNYAREQGHDIPRFPYKFWRIRKTHRTLRAIKRHNKIRMLASSGIRDTTMLMLVSESGRRRGGLCDLQIKNIRIWHNPEKGWRMIARVREKGDKPVFMFATDQTTRTLQIWLELREKLLASMGVLDHGYVFISYTTGKPLRPESMTRIAGQVKQIADISMEDSANLHSFRHRAAKEMLKEGMTLPEVRDILGHASSVTTADLYVQNDEEELADTFFTNRNQIK